jgi:V/A-type H+-transporting ATPase subunit D
MRTAEEVLRESSELERSVGESAVALALAEALDGPEAVGSAAFAAQGQVALEVTGVNIMGVPVPLIEKKSVARSPLDRGYSLSGVSSRIDAVAEAFEAQLDLVIELAASEMRLRRLAEEIGRTTRRVNALDHVLIPRLEAERTYIQMVMEEREREDLFRLKRVKVKLGRRPPASPAA